MDKIKAAQFADLAYYCRYVPPPYQRVEYLQSSSSNGLATSIHIDTGIYGFVDFEITLMRTDNQPTKFAGTTGDHCLQRSGGDGRFAFYGSYIYNSSASILTKTTCKWKDGKIYINGTQVSTQVKPADSGIQFALYGVGNGAGYTNIRIYDCKLWDLDGNLIRDMYPCRRTADSVLGFYDTVTDTFYPPVGTVGSFIAGNDVN